MHKGRHCSSQFVQSMYINLFHFLVGLHLLNVEQAQVNKAGALDVQRVTALT